MKYIGITLLVLIGIVGITFFTDALGLTEIKIFGVKTENVRREVFEQSQSYVEGKRQELTKYRLEYMRSKDPAERRAIQATILQSMANFDEDKLPPDLQGFLDQLKNAP